MIRAPLNVIPAWTVHILQTKVALDRIATYLAEDEVSEQVSSLKHNAEVPDDELPGAENEEGLGIAAGTFKWNEVEEKPKDEKDTKDTKSRWSISHIRKLNNLWTRKVDPVSTTESVGDSGTEVGSEQDFTEDHKFELKDISVVFPEGQLSIITGPTASGYVRRYLSTT